MEKEGGPPQEARSYGTEPILLDCYTELIAYTGYLLKRHAAGPLPYESVAAVYTRLVDRSRKKAASFGFSEDLWQEAFFPVCAYIDEALLCSDWPDRSTWERAQLQRQYFNTTSAGSEFFNRLEQIDGSAGSIREVYAFCMALGFRGRYFQPSDDGKLEDIRYTHLKRVTENIDLTYPEELFPEAYGRETDEKIRKQIRWKRVSLFSPGAVLLPIGVFAALYWLFERLLNAKMIQYFGASF